jgi:small subunit ribosomal protein S16
MTTRIRLRRMGSKGRPFYRVVVADQRSPRDGRFIENIGKYHPLNDPSVIEIDEARALYWLRVGAQPSDQVRNLMTKVGIWETFVAERPAAGKTVKAPKDRPAKEKVSKKAQAKAEEAAAQAAPVPEPEPEAALAEGDAPDASAEAPPVEGDAPETAAEETAEA